MKKFFLAVASAGLLITIPACKKGENDPFLSLNSRKARLAGVYEFTSWESHNETFVDGPFQYYSYSDISIEQGTGTQVTSTALELSGEPFSDTKTKNIRIDNGEFIIDKDGSWEFTMNITLTWEEDAGSVINDYYEFTQRQTINQSGNWEFLPKSDSFKNKERVLFSEVTHQAFVLTTKKVVFVDGSSSTWVIEEGAISHNGPSKTIYEIDGLKNKEMILRRPKEGVRVQNEGENNPMSISLVTEGMVEMHLTQ
ncbi:MAG: hypothetical protein MI810_02410 [Flavobacteriales bacterium]|nr:hypothetical protein [Flavobacteriales bacterium]